MSDIYPLCPYQYAEGKLRCAAGMARPCPDCTGPKPFDDNNSWVLRQRWLNGDINTPAVPHEQERQLSYEESLAALL